MAFCIAAYYKQGKRAGWYTTGGLSPFQYDAKGYKVLPEARLRKLVSERPHWDWAIESSHPVGRRGHRVFRLVPRLVLEGDECTDAD